MEEDLKKAMEMFDDSHEMPMDGHVNRFETKLMLRSDRKIRASYSRRFIFISVAAASICLIIISVAIVKMNSMGQDEITTETIEEWVSPDEVKHAQKFYEKRRDISIVHSSSNDATIQKFMAKLNYLESQYEVLQKAYQMNQDNQKIIDAMVDNYRFRLQIVEMMQKYVQINNRSNNENKTDL